MSSGSSTTADLAAILGCMWTLVLILLAVWLLVSILGIVIKGLFWLFVIGAILFVVTSLVGWSKRES